MTTRTALVGGGSAGIGYATASRLARSGHSVVLTGRRADALESAALRLKGETGGDVGWIAADMSVPEAAAAVITDAAARFGGPDVLVLNAGGPPPGRILAVSDERLLDAFRLLLLGPLAMARAALPLMTARGCGRIVFVTSAAVRQPQPDLAASVVLRSAVTAAAKLLSLEFAAEGVTVNCVAPGATATGRRREILENRATATGATYDELDRADTASIPAGRPAWPDEVAATIAFLVSAEASYLNGTVLTVDGGRTETI